MTLGDGTVVAADQLLYTYSVSGSGTTPTGVDFEVTGDGQLDLWVDPATGLRLREQRTFSTTTTSAPAPSRSTRRTCSFPPVAATELIAFTRRQRVYPLCR